MKQARGFTLLEVLVAIAVLSLALLAAIRSTSAAIQTTEALRQRIAADWVAADRLAEHRVRRTWPGVGEREGEITQAGVRLLWRERVAATPNSRFRRVEVTVFSSDSSAQPLTTLSGFLVNRPK
jgi:general secretion pathway protein I